MVFWSRCWYFSFHLLSSQWRSEGLERFCFKRCSSSGMTLWRCVYNLREQIMEVNKLYLNKLCCMAHERAVQACVPKAASGQAGSQICISTKFPSWDINPGRNQPQCILHSARCIEFNTRIEQMRPPRIFFLFFFSQYCHETVFQRYTSTLLLFFKTKISKGVFRKSWGVNPP